jgi:hypothetical protein
MPSQELLDELKIVMKEDYGVDLGPQELLEVANGLIGFFEIWAENINKG